MMTGYCGINCENCGNYLKNANCLGCRVDQEMISDCDIRDCCKEKGVEYCGLCPDFSCEKIEMFYSGRSQYTYAKAAMIEMKAALEKKDPQKTVRVVAAVIRDGDRVFATQRGYGDYKDWWEFPGGKVEEGETPQQALAREIREELDTQITVGNFIACIEHDYPEFHLSMNCYWAAVASGDLTLLEHESSKWIPLDDLDSVDWLPADRKLLPLLNADA